MHNLCQPFQVHGSAVIVHIPLETGHHQFILCSGFATLVAGTMIGISLISEMVRSDGYPGDFSFSPCHWPQSIPNSPRYVLSLLTKALRISNLRLGVW